MTTKQHIYAQLKTLENLTQLCTNLKNNIKEIITLSDDDDFAEIINAFGSEVCSKLLNIDEPASAENLMSYLTDNQHFEQAKIKDGPEITVPKLELNTNLLWFTIKVPTDNGHLIVYNCESDFGTKQIGMDYSVENETDELTVQIATAEIKKGELAEVSHLSSDNKDVDVYTYSNVFDEDYTDKFTIKHNDVLSLLDEE
ncbi:hypothetical protein J6A31_09085 [bacterium]|nr:hypothetical protein [bacterium]